jgi:hypothetical protein
MPHALRNFFTVIFHGSNLHLNSDYAVSQFVSFLIVLSEFSSRKYFYAALETTYGW